MGYLEDFKQTLREKGIAESFLNLEDDKYILRRLGENTYALVVPSRDTSFVFSNGSFKGLFRDMSSD